jgi:tetratricopeptide (TPR) repeat protein
MAERASLVRLVEQVHTARLWARTWRLAELLPVMSDWRSWERTHQLALDAARQAGDADAEAGIMRSLGALYRELGRYDEAVALLTRAAEIFENHGDRQRWAAVPRNLGDVYRYQGRLAEAIEAFSAGLAVFRSAGDSRAEAGALNGMADAHRGLSQWAEAGSAFQACIGIYHDLADRLEEARAGIRYALVFRDQYLSERAIPLLEDGLRVVRELGDRRWWRSGAVDGPGAGVVPSGRDRFRGEDHRRASGVVMSSMPAAGEATRYEEILAGCSVRPGDLAARFVRASRAARAAVEAASEHEAAIWDVPPPGPFTPCAVTHDQPHRQGDGLRAAGTTDGDAKRTTAIQEDPVGGMSALAWPGAVVSVARRVLVMAGGGALAAWVADRSLLSWACLLPRSTSISTSCARGRSRHRSGCVMSGTGWAWRSAGVFSAWRRSTGLRARSTRGSASGPTGGR